MKRAIPIVSSNAKYFGLTVPEWALSLFPLFLFTTILSKLLLYYIPLHIIALIAYVRILSQMEENIVGVVSTWIRIPDVIMGYFNKPIPYIAVKTHTHDEE